ncbi:MAG: nucleotidyltransferase family protein [Chloroflexota bacterium]
MRKADTVTKAMILAAGEGTRLRPLTADTPKPLLPLAGVPLILYSLALLRQHGICEVAVNLHHNAQKIVDCLGDGSRLGMKIHYSYEEALLGTAGGLRKVAHLFDDTFVVLYGDVLTDCDLSALIRFHRKQGGPATLALSEVTNPWEVGIVQLDQDGRVLDFVEKPPRGSAAGNLANGGIYVMERVVLDYVPKSGPCDFGYDVFPHLLREGLPIYGYLLPAKTYLVDIGTLDKYRRAEADVAAGIIKTGILFVGSSQGSAGMQHDRQCDSLATDLGVPR